MTLATVLVLVFQLHGQPAHVSQIVPTGWCNDIARRQVDELLTNPGITSINWSCLNANPTGQDH